MNSEKAAKFSQSLLQEASNKQETAFDIVVLFTIPYLFALMQIDQIVLPVITLTPRTLLA